MTEDRRAAWLQCALSLFMRRPSPVSFFFIYPSTTEKEGMSTIAAFMLAILPVLDASSDPLMRDEPAATKNAPCAARSIRLKHERSRRST